jgi:hypothetical protein
MEFPEKDFYVLESKPQEVTTFLEKYLWRDDLQSNIKRHKLEKAFLQLHCNHSSKTNYQDELMQKEVEFNSEVLANIIEFSLRRASVYSELYTNFQDKCHYINLNYLTTKYSVAKILESNDVIKCEYIVDNNVDYNNINIKLLKDLPTVYPSKQNLILTFLLQVTPDDSQTVPEYLCLKYDCDGKIEGINMPREINTNSLKDIDLNYFLNNEFPDFLSGEVVHIRRGNTKFIFPLTLGQLVELYKQVYSD